jgi:hypothetical protein
MRPHECAAREGPRRQSSKLGTTSTIRCRLLLRPNQAAVAALIAASVRRLGPEVETGIVEVEIDCPLRAPGRALCESHRPM